MKLFFVYLYPLFIFLYACSDQKTETPTTYVKQQFADTEIINTAVDISKAEGGRQVYANWCAHCHDSGNSHPGTMRMAARLGDEGAILLERDDLSEAYIRHIVREGLMMMPPFRHTEITPEDLDMLIYYILNNTKLDSN